MTSSKQIAAARSNIKKAQAAWQSMTPRQRALRQPEGRNRARPGTTGRGNYFRIVVRPDAQFVSFRIQDVGQPGGLQRVAGRRSSGSWATQAWLVSKDKAHARSNSLVADDEDTRELFAQFQNQPALKEGDIYTAKDRKNVPERLKPTEAQRRARSANILKAQAAWRRLHPAI